MPQCGQLIWKGMSHLRIEPGTVVTHDGPCESTGTFEFSAAVPGRQGILAAKFGAGRAGALCDGSTRPAALNYYSKRRQRRPPS